MAPAHVPSFLFAVLIGSFAYGIALTLFITSVTTIVRKKRATGRCNLPLVIPSALIFVLATVNIIGVWYNAYLTFIVNGYDPLSFLELIRTPAKTVFQTGEVGAIILTDALLVYRTWVIWNHNFYIIAIPSLTLSGTFISAVYYVNLQHHTNVETSVFNPTITRWTIAFLMCSFFTTVYSTGVIVFKLWKSQLELRNYGVSANNSRIHHIARIFVESAALYAITHLIYVTLYELEDQVEITTSYLEANMATITCSLIIIRSETVYISDSTSINSVPTIKEMP